MIIKRTLFILLLAALALSACSSNRTFTSEAGNFTVTGPAALKEQPQSIEAGSGKLDAHTFTGEAANITYVVAYTDYQPDAISNLDSQQLLNNARDSMVRGTGGELLREGNLTLGDYPGRDITVFMAFDDGTTGNLRAHLFLVKDRLYQVMVMAHDADLKNASIDKFLDSFKLLKNQ